MRDLADDPNTLANLIVALGGEIVPGNTLRFNLPKSEVRDVIPRINNLGLGVRKISERRTDDMSAFGKVHDVTLLEVYRKPRQNLTAPD